MKDAKGHGSDRRGAAHQTGVDEATKHQGKAVLIERPSWVKNAETTGSIRRYLGNGNFLVRFPSGGEGEFHKSKLTIVSH